jgi:DNA-binding transcriptional regulator YbjK
LTAPRRASPRDPEGRRRLLSTAAAEIIAEDGLAQATHRAIADRAGVPLGSATYYFSTLHELHAAGLEEATAATRALLQSWRDELTNAPDKAPVLIRLVERYLKNRPRALVEYELYLAAARTPDLRPLAGIWIDEVREILGTSLDPEIGRAVVALLDGLMLQALVLDIPFDAGAFEAAFRRLTE